MIPGGIVSRGLLMLTEAQWAVLAPLLEGCRPRGKTQPHDLKRTVDAILWRHWHDTNWRAVPAHYGPWWMAAQTFIRWSRLGVWEQLLARLERSFEESGLLVPGIDHDEFAYGGARKKELQDSELQVRQIANMLLSLQKQAAVA
ncbi:transposase [Methylobacterium aquaticum]